MNQEEERSHKLVVMEKSNQVSEYLLAHDRPVVTTFKSCSFAVRERPTIIVNIRSQGVPYSKSLLYDDEHQVYKKAPCGPTWFRMVS